MIRKALAIVSMAAAVAATPAQAQVFPPGTFRVDGVPVVCGWNTFILNPQLGDVGMNNGQGQIFLNPMVLAPMPTPVKLFWVGHECGHSAVGADEAAADCWSIKTGKNQGWFPPQAFQVLMMELQNNPGDFSHAPGPVRFQNMVACYQS